MSIEFRLSGNMWQRSLLGDHGAPQPFVPVNQLTQLGLTATTIHRDPIFFSVTSWPPAASGPSQSVSWTIASLAVLLVIFQLTYVPAFLSPLFGIARS